MENPVRVSVIISARNEEEHIGKTINSLLSNTNEQQFEIIAVNDGSTDKTENVLGQLKSPYLKTIKTNGLGTARARNFALRFARGDLLIFSDAHINVPQGWLEKINSINSSHPFDILSVPIGPDHLGYGIPEFIGYGQTLDEKLSTQWLLEKPQQFAEVPVAPGGFVIYKKDVFKAIQGYDAGFNTWGLEDIEISIKAWLMGYTTQVLTDFSVSHHFRIVTPFQVDMLNYLYNLYRIGILHFNDHRIEKLKQKICQTLEKVNIDPQNGLKNILNMSEAAGIIKQRYLYLENRKYSDDWFFDKFGINF